MSDKSKNPWGLTDGEAKVMTAICEHGCQKLAARALGKSIKTIQGQAFKAGEKIGGSTLGKYIAWDRWSRGE